jgi:glycosyltransferase involved in cell wall biosynthesis
LSSNLPNIFVIIPAFNEQDSIGKVINDIPKRVKEIIVVNNNSTDNTAKVATQFGAKVLNQTIQGYGASCLMGIDYLLKVAQPTDIVVFMDGDYADYPQELIQLIEPIESRKFDFVVGSRALGNAESGSLTIPQRFGNWLAGRLIQLFYGLKVTDLGPFRAITMESLVQLNMIDLNYGWTAEMQVKAAKNNMRYTEVPVNYKKRIGVSKVSGTLKGTIMAGYKIVYTIFKYSFK